MPYAEPFETILRKARYGRRNWIAYRTPAGDLRYGYATAETIKAALLAIGVKGSCSLYSAGTGHPYRITWPLGITLLANAKRGLL